MSETAMDIVEEPVKSEPVKNSPVKAGTNCFNCDETGHWMRECPQELKVKPVEKLKSPNALKWNESEKGVPKVVIPKDTSIYPGFPNTEGMPKEEADAAIISFWKVWRKNKDKRKKLERKLDETNVKRSKKGLPPLKSLDDVDKMEANNDNEPEKERQPYLPRDIRSYPNCPDTTGMDSKEETRILLEFYYDSKKNKQKEKMKERQRKKKELVSLALKGECPEGEKFPESMFNIPEDISSYPGYPNTEGLTEGEANEKIQQFCVSWRKEQAEKYIEKGKAKKKAKSKAQNEKKRAEYKQLKCTVGPGYSRYRDTNSRNYRGNSGYGHGGDWLQHHSSGYSRNNSQDDWNINYNNYDQSGDYYNNQSYDHSTYDNYYGYNSRNNFGNQHHQQFNQRGPHQRFKLNESEKGVPKVVIPKDTSMYPGFPNTEGMPKEEADAAIISFWKVWRKNKEKRKKLKRKLDEKNLKRSIKGLPPLKSLDDDDKMETNNDDELGAPKKSKPDLAESSSKPTDLPKPTKTLVKILDQLKNCPFGVNIHESKERKNPISAEEFTEIMSEINQNWFEQMDASSQSLKIEGSEWYGNRGIILCQDEFSRNWIQKSIDDIQIGGKVFKAWSSDESGFVVDASVLLGLALDKCPNPRDVITKALENSGIPAGNVEVIDVNKTKDGRLVNLLMEEKVANALKEKNGKIFAGLAPLAFRF